MKKVLRLLPGSLLASVAVTGSPAVAAVKFYPEKDRAEFRELVDDYQLFVVPHCTPDVVAEYDRMNGARDATFVRSLKGTPLLSDYRKAVANRARRDKGTIYECSLYPPPPPGVVISPADIERTRRENRDRHFTEGDKQFARMVALRDKLAVGQGK